MTNAQRITLIARSAWQRLDAAGAIDETFDAWRHREAEAVVGCRISAASSPQLDRLETHFLSIAGQPAKALDAELGEDGQTKRRRYVIRQLATQLGLPADYAAAKPAHTLTGIIIELRHQLRHKTPA
jgi:hypothetical protein